MEQQQRRGTDARAQGIVNWNEPGTELPESSTVHLFRPRMLAYPIWHHITSYEMLEAAQAKPDEFEVWTLFKVPVDGLSRAPVSVVAAAAAALGKIERRQATVERRIDDRHPDQPLQWDDAGGAIPAAAPAAGQAGLAKLCDQLIDIWDDGRRNAPEDRVYIEGALDQVVEEIRIAALAVPLAATPVAATEQAINFDAFYKAWRKVGADVAGLRWEDFVKHLATPADAGAGEGLTDERINGLYHEHCPNIRGFARAIEREVLARMSTSGAQVTASGQSSTHLINAGALRQFRHNDGSDGFVFAYDKEIADREFARLVKKSDSLPYESVLNGFIGIMGVEDSGDLLDDARRAIDKVNAMIAGQSPAQVTAEPVATDLSKHLRAVASNPMYVDHVHAKKSTLLAAAEEIERYYGGMLNWKRTAEAKDREFATHSAPADRDAIRDQVLEDAAEAAGGAEVATSMHGMVLHDDGAQTLANAVAAIRALKTQPSASPTATDAQSQKGGV